MDLNMIRPKKETKKLLLSITKNCQTLIEQTHKKPEETLEFNMIKSRETFHFKQSIHLKGDWMLRLTDLEVYNSIFDITKKITNSNFIQTLLTNFHLWKEKMKLMKSLIFQILQIRI